MMLFHAKTVRFGLLLLFFFNPAFVSSQDIRNIQAPMVKHEANHLLFEVIFESSTPLSLYYKPAELEEYQCRVMKEESPGKWSCLVEADTLYGQTLEYYIQVEGSSGSAVSSLFTMDISFLSSTPSGTEAPPSPPPPSSPLLRIGASLSGDFFIAEGGSQESQVVNKVDINGNIRLYRNITKGDTQIDLDSTFSYMKNHAENDKAFNLQTMIVRFKHKEHLFEMGDTNINYSEYSASYLNRRGLLYSYNSQHLNFGAFWTNSQQKTGFNGLGFPPANGMLLGAHAGFNLSQRVIVQGVFITGKDDQSSKTLYTSEDAYREGSLFTLLGTVHVVPGHWSLEGEFTKSSFGSTASAEDELEKESDSAWRAGTSFSLGPLNGRVQYQNLGEHFNSIANLFLQNDREGLQGSLSVSHKSFSLNLSYMDQQTYIHHPTQPSQKNRNLGAQLNWLIANHLNLGGEFSLDNLEYDASTGLHTGGEDMDTWRGAVFLGFISGANSITFRVGKTESKTFTSNIDASIAVNLRLGSFFSISPTASFQRTTNLSDDSNSDILSFFASGELCFVPEIATLTFTGSYSQSKNPYADSDTLSLGVNANLYLAKIFQNKVQPSVSLRSQYQKGTYNSESSDAWTVFLHADLAF